MYDADGDGHITGAELRTVLQVRAVREPLEGR
jgi:hypothetical protein